MKLVLALLLATDIPRDQVIPMMAFMANSLSVTCTHCHVNKEWASDAKPAKAIARREIAMVRAINERHYGGELVVTCNTCHNGSVRPRAIPPVANAGWNKPPAPPPEQLPSADQVVTRYLAALGDLTAKSHTSRGTVTRTSGREEPVTQPFTLYQEPPSTVRIDTQLSYPPEANREFARFFLSAPKLREQYTAFTTIGSDTIGGRKVIVVEATPAAGRRERLFFDAQSGLLLRRYKETMTLMGPLGEEYDFDDWRTVGRARLPFLMQWSRADYRVTHHFEAVE